MCTFLAAAGAGLQMLGQVAAFGAKQQEIDAYNQQAMVNARDASLAATHKYEDEGRKYIYDSRQIQQEGYKATMKGREAIGTAKASAGASGFDASSLSVASILAAENQKTEMNLDNIRTKQDDLEDSYRSRVRTYEAEAQGRINSMPLKPDANPLGLMINIASAGLGAYKSTL